MAIKKVTKTFIDPNGRTIRVCDLGDKELLNTIANMDEQAQRDMDRWKEEASGVFFPMVTEDFRPPTYSFLVLEAVRRGLTMGKKG